MKRPVDISKLILRFLHPHHEKHMKWQPIILILVNYVPCTNKIYKTTLIKKVNKIATIFNIDYSSPINIEFLNITKYIFLWLPFRQVYR